jgi:hypothetical protein
MFTRLMEIWQYNIASKFETLLKKCCKSTKFRKISYCESFFQPISIKIFKLIKLYFPLKWIQSMCYGEIFSNLAKFGIHNKLYYVLPTIAFIHSCYRFSVIKMHKIRTKSVKFSVKLTSVTP